MGKPTKSQIDKAMDIATEALRDTVQVDLMSAISEPPDPSARWPTLT